MTIKITHNNIPKPAHVIGYVERLLAGEKLTEYELVELYNYHTLKANAKIKDNFAWVAKACNAKDLRPITHFVFVHEGQAYATNGSTMRVAPVDLPNGNYDPKLRTLSVGNQELDYVGNIKRVYTPTAKGVVNSTPSDTILICGEKYTRFDNQFYPFEQTNGANAYQHNENDGKLYCDFGDGRILLTMAMRKEWSAKNGVKVQ